ncbi:glycoside hydrolase family 32 protein [Rathayibacter sp. VKM Ac-2630]|uniref:glycoside hydrolase family 32 protein n=1 Tax=Rathayibacter sp. VKM Ac-2630 TaxID=1938617 RepID=UPI0009812729|nr:glycoside hydrolase family 32 protein [Rathayibacter sp. VKM Ac-2630]
MTETIGTAGEAESSSALDRSGAPAHDLLFQPARGWVGDVIPVERDGEFHLFYLHELRDDPKPGTAWSLVTTRDFVHFEDRGVSLPHGGADEDDFNAYTGSVVHDDGVDHLFYTGHNPWRLGPDGVTPLQVVMHATSVDGMRTWVKHPEDTFGATEGFEPGDWRDPFVFRSEPEGEWRMLLAARHVDGPSRRRGTIAQLVSSDLRSWRPVAPFWDPRRYIAHECPDVFPWGAHWYLVSSEFSEDFTTRYRIADSVDGPWRVPLHDSVDGRAFYASKSVERDGRRFFAGWIASKEDSRDDGAYQWAGTMSVLEALQRDDGTLGFTLPEEVLAAFDEELPVVLHDESGAVDSRDEIRLAVPDGYAARLGAFDLPPVFSASVRFDIAEGTTECGILLRSSADGDESYVLRLEPTRNRMVLDRWPRRLTGPMQWQISGDVPFAVELERPADLSPGEHRLDLIVDGSALVAVLDRSVALSARIYDRPTGRIGLFAGEGEVVFRDLRLRRRTT